MSDIADAEVEAFRREMSKWMLFDDDALRKCLAAAYAARAPSAPAAPSGQQSEAGQGGSEER